MNKNLYLILIVAFIFYGCFSDDTSKAKVDLELIDAKVNSYEYSTAFLKFYYSDKGFSDSAEAYRMINQMINTFEANFIAFVDSGSTKADFDDMNLFLENNCSKCVDLIGEFKFNFSLEKNYLFKLKYVECIIEKSGWYTTKLNELYERKMDKYFKRLHSK